MFKLYPIHLTAFQNKTQGFLYKYSTSYKVKFTMFGIQTKSIRLAKRQENITQNEEKKKLVETDPQKIQMIKFIYNNISKELL